MARPLPTPFDEITIPEMFSPTAIASAGGCQLRMIAASTPKPLPSLPSGPFVELGILAHRVLERYSRGAGPAGSVFDACERESLKRLHSDASMAHYADLPSAVGLAYWSRFRANLVARCERVPVRAQSIRASQTRTPILVGTERVLTSTKLRLKGRPDQMRRMGAVLEIRDYKTGRIHDAAGELRSEIVIQLWCYGLLVLERDPMADIRLIVDNGEDHEIPFGLAEQKQARRAIRRALRGFAAGRSFSAITLASPGESCANCPVRDRCRAYLSVAPTWWRLGPETPDELARDVWGIVTAVSTDSAGAISVVLKDAVDRKVKIDRLDSRHCANASWIGREVWFFNLESTVFRRASNGRRLHPMSFHELPADSAQRCAWALRLYVGGPPL